ncbi:MAG: gamma-glutamylcyclotransferase [Rhodospirillaceae bacterium]|nr:gamma-glutamylcyclotransferase [Rhodospirillaceae bacterium]MDE0616411.1 gamma-glutamylcyclotransferase [Rhodospirillaceae bacterium]
MPGETGSEAAPGPEPDDIPWPAGRAEPLDATALAASRAAAMARRPAGPVWVFGYGSLIWNPAFEPAERRRAVLHGYRRAFCFWTVSARGTPERPGLGLGLEAAPGARCGGVALRIAGATEAADIERLWAREMYTAVYRPAWVPLHTAGATDGPDPVPFTALAFVIDPAHPQYCPPLGADRQARIIAGAAGKFGPCADYLADMVVHLAEAGEPDAELEALLERVQRLRD